VEGNSSPNVRRNEQVDEKVLRVSRWQCKTGDTVPLNMSKPSGSETSAKNENNLD